MTHEEAVGIAIVYGNWCGPDHGGYQDCCGGRPCPNCNQTETGISQACIEECMPVDQLDWQCAFHDHCTFTQGAMKGCGGALASESNFCDCDCLIVNRAAKITNCDELTNPACAAAYEAITTLFEHSKCWYYEHESKVCNDSNHASRGFCDPTILPYSETCVGVDCPANSFCAQYPSTEGILECPCYVGFGNSSGVCVLD